MPRGKCVRAAPCGHGEAELCDVERYTELLGAVISQPYCEDAPAGALPRLRCLTCAAAEPANAPQPSCAHALALDTCVLELFCKSCRDYIYDDAFDDAVQRAAVAMRSTAQLPTPALPPSDPGRDLAAKRRRLLAASTTAAGDGSGSGAVSGSGSGAAGGSPGSGSGATAIQEAANNAASSTAAGMVALSGVSGWRPLPAPTDGFPRGLRGLNNLGNTCFANSVLQVLFHTPLLAAFFLGEGHDPSCCRLTAREKPCLSCQMESMFGEVYSGTRTPLSPAEFLREWWRFAAGLAGDRQQDAHEFFLSLLEGLAGSMLPLPGLLEADDAQRGSAGSGGSGGSAPDNAAANGGGVPPLPLALSQPQPPQQQQRQQQHGGASPLLQGQAAGGVTPYGCWRQTPVPSSLLGGELSGCETPVSSAIMTPEPDCGPDVASSAPTGACSSLVEAVFSGLLRSDVRCCACGHTSTAHDPFRDLSLDLHIPRPPRLPPQQPPSRAVLSVPTALAGGGAAGAAGAARAGSGGGGAASPAVRGVAASAGTAGLGRLSLHDSAGLLAARPCEPTPPLLLMTPSPTPPPSELMLMVAADTDAGDATDEAPEPAASLHADASAECVGAASPHAAVRGSQVHQAPASPAPPRAASAPAGMVGGTAAAAAGVTGGSCAEEAGDVEIEGSSRSQTCTDVTPAGLLCGGPAASSGGGGGAAAAAAATAAVGGSAVSDAAGSDERGGGDTSPEPWQLGGPALSQSSQQLGVEAPSSAGAAGDALLTPDMQADGRDGCATDAVLLDSSVAAGTTTALGMRESTPQSQQQQQQQPLSMLQQQQLMYQQHLQSLQQQQQQHLAHMQAPWGTSPLVTDPSWQQQSAGLPQLSWKQQQQQQQPTVPAYGAAGTAPGMAMQGPAVDAALPRPQRCGRCKYCLNKRLKKGCEVARRIKEEQKAAGAAAQKKQQLALAATHMQQQQQPFGSALSTHAHAMLPLEVMQQQGWHDSHHSLHQQYQQQHELHYSQQQQQQQQYWYGQGQHWPQQLMAPLQDAAALQLQAPPPDMTATQPSSATTLPAPAVASRPASAPPRVAGAAAATAGSAPLSKDVLVQAALSKGLMQRRDEKGRFFRKEDLQAWARQLYEEGLLSTPSMPAVSAEAAAAARALGRPVPAAVRAAAAARGGGGGSSSNVMSAAAKAETAAAAGSTAAPAVGAAASTAAGASAAAARTQPRAASAATPKKHAAGTARAAGASTATPAAKKSTAGPAPSIILRMNDLTLPGCLRRFVRPERLGPGAHWRCGACGSTEAALKQMSIRRLPPVLCLHVKRFHHGGGARTRKLDVPLRFPLAGLDMSPFTTSEVLRAAAGMRSAATNVGHSDHGDDDGNGGGSGAGDDARGSGGGSTTTGSSNCSGNSNSSSSSFRSRCLYELFGVVSHHGDMSSGHYVSYVRAGGAWYLMNDPWVVPVSEADVAAAQAYLLFYRSSSLLCAPTGGGSTVAEHTGTAASLAAAAVAAGVDTAAVKSEPRS